MRESSPSKGAVSSRQTDLCAWSAAVLSGNFQPLPGGWQPYHIPFLMLGLLIQGNRTYEYSDLTALLQKILFPPLTFKSLL